MLTASGGSFFYNFPAYPYILPLNLTSFPFTPTSSDLILTRIHLAVTRRAKSYPKRFSCEIYCKLCAAFNPVFFNADEWVQLAKDAGMEYMVVTSKHHDGFALFHSKVSKYNVVDATPFGRDVIGELANACAKKGLRLGLYYSQDLDWSEPNGGGYTAGHTWCGFGPWTNEWDFPDNAKKNYTQCFEDKIVPQVEEILTNYGELALIWFDTPQTLSEAQSRHLYDMVRKLQPECLVNSRIGNGLGDYRSLGDNEIPESGLAEGLVESACTLRKQR